MAVGGTCERGSPAQLGATSQCLSGKRSYAKTPGTTKSDEGITVWSIVTAMCTIYPSVCAKSLLRAKLRVSTFAHLVNHHHDATKCPSLNAVCRAQRNDREDCKAPALRMTRSIKEKLPFFLVFLVAGCELDLRSSMRQRERPKGAACADYHSLVREQSRIFDVPAWRFSMQLPSTSMPFKHIAQSALALSGPSNTQFALL